MDTPAQSHEGSHSPKNTAASSSLWSRPIKPIFFLPVLLTMSFVLILVLYLAFVANQRSEQTQELSQQPQQPTVPLRTEYKNPFEKNTQYTNPFSEYKNPFDNVK